MDMTQLTHFFGWMTVFNFIGLILSALLLIPFNATFAGMHARMFGLEQGTVKNFYFGFIALWEVLTFVFCLMPYLALRLAM